MKPSNYGLDTQLLNSRIQISRLPSKDIEGNEEMNVENNNETKSTTYATYYIFRMILLFSSGLFSAAFLYYEVSQVNLHYLTHFLPFYFCMPSFVFESPYMTSSYYTSSTSIDLMWKTSNMITKTREKRRRLQIKTEARTRLAIVRPFCAFDAETLPATFESWNSFAPCKSSSYAVDDDLYEAASGSSKSRVVDLFLFYSQTYLDSEEAVKSVESVIKEFHERGGWSQCFDNVYAIEAKIPADLDLYIPSAQHELFNWVNGPNRQFEAAYRIIQSGEWGHYDGFYLMEGDSVPVKSFWLDIIIETIEANRPFAILGAKYNGDKWDPFFTKIPFSLIHHINGNAIYNTSHPFLDLLVGQLEIEAPSPYNSFPYDYRMSQILVEGILHHIPEIAPKILLNDDGDNYTVSNNTEMFSRWWDMHKDDMPFKETPVIQNFAATNIVPRHIGPEYIIHGAKLYSHWDPMKVSITLVISEWYKQRSNVLLSKIDKTDHPFSKIVIMLPPSVDASDKYNMTSMKVINQHRNAPDYMDLCDVNVDTEWFMITNAYHQVAYHTDTMFTQASFKPVIPFTPVTYEFCLKFPYCKAGVDLAQRFNHNHNLAVEDFDMVFNTHHRNLFCEEWKRRYGDEGERLYDKKTSKVKMKMPEVGPKGPTGTSMIAYLIANGKDTMYKFTDRSLYGARPAFIKVLTDEEKLDAMSPDELTKHIGILTSKDDVESNRTCNCNFYNRNECDHHNDFCTWRNFFNKCRPLERPRSKILSCRQTMHELLPRENPGAWVQENVTQGTKGQKYHSRFSESGKENIHAPRHDPLFAHEFNLESKFMTHEDDFILHSSGTEKHDIIDSTQQKKKNGRSIFSSLFTKSNTQEEKKKDHTQEEGRGAHEYSSTSSWFTKLITEQEKSDDRKHSITNSAEQKNKGDHEYSTTSSWFTKSITEREKNNENRADHEYSTTSSWFTQPTTEKKKNNDHEPSTTSAWFTKHITQLDKSRELKYNITDSTSTANAIKDEERLTPASNVMFGESQKKYSGIFDHNKQMDYSKAKTNVLLDDVGGSFSKFIHTIPEKKCQRWGPSIVPRPPLADDFIQKAALQFNNETNSSHYRELHLQEIIIGFLPEYNAPIRKTSDLRFEAEEVGMDILSPIIDITRDVSVEDSFISNVDYGSCHPHEDVFDSSKCNGNNGNLYKPLRVLFITNELEQKREDTGNDIRFLDVRINAVLKEILPQVSQLWKEVLSVIPVKGNLFPVGLSCGEATSTTSHKAKGFERSDLVIYVSVEGAYCSGVPGYSSVCNFDQHMRPIVGNLALCLDEIIVKDNFVSQEELLRQIGYQVHEIGKILGLSTSMFQHYRNPDSGKPWGTTSQNVTCVDGGYAVVDFPNILNKGHTDKGNRPYYEVSSPSVLQAVRNHFDCQLITGARLDNHASSRSCFGSHWDERFFFGEDLTPLHDRSRQAFAFTPLSLALLEDSSWYKANFSMAENNPFGHGAGCGFLQGECIVDGKVPEYSQGYFCSAIPSESGFASSCDYSYNHKASCDLSTSGNPPLDYLMFVDEPDWGSHFADVDFCPMNSNNLISCMDTSQSVKLDGETFGGRSKCFETDTLQSVCLETYCNEDVQRLEIFVGGKVFFCDYDGAVLDLGRGYQIKCPRLASVCPNLVCPSGCSGKGICDYCLEVPQCICDDPFDETPGCWGVSS